MNEKGFNLIDVTITCLLLGLVATFGLTEFDGLTHQNSLQTAAQGLMSDLSRARFAALAGNLPVAIRVRPDGAGYSVVEEGSPPAWRELPQGVRFIGYPKSSVTFYSRGSAVPAGTFTLMNPAGQIQVIVAGSGRARWKRVM